MRKCLSLFVIIAVVALGLVGALALVPHSHGTDTDHSRHQTCPIYQFSLAHIGVHTLSLEVIAALFVSCFFIAVRKVKTYDFDLFFLSLRAPPLSV